MAEQAKVPAIRFAGFTDPWEQRKLGELVTTTIGGGTPSTSNPAYWDGEIPWIQSSNVLEDTLFDVDIPKAITQKGLEESAAQIVPENSIAVVTHVGVGKLIYLPFQYSTSQDFISLCGLKGDAQIYLAMRYGKGFKKTFISFRALRLKESPKKTCSRRIYQCLVLKSSAQIGVFLHATLTTSSPFISVSMTSLSSLKNRCLKKCSRKMVSLYPKFALLVLLTLGNSVSWESWR